MYHVPHYCLFHRKFRLDLNVSDLKKITEIVKIIKRKLERKKLKKTGKIEKI